MPWGPPDRTRFGVAVVQVVVRRIWQARVLACNYPSGEITQENLSAWGDQLPVIIRTAETPKWGRESVDRRRQLTKLSPGTGDDLLPERGFESNLGDLIEAREQRVWSNMRLMERKIAKTDDPVPPRTFWLRGEVHWELLCCRDGPEGLAKVPSVPRAVGPVREVPRNSYKCHFLQFPIVRLVLEDEISKIKVNVLKAEGALRAI